MRLSFRQLPLGDAVAFWNVTVPPEWSVDVATLANCVVGCPCFDWGTSGAWMADGEIVALAWVKKSASMAYRGPDPDTAHLSAIAFRDAPAAADLLADIKHLLRQRGVAALQFGRDARHLFPGVPETWPGMADFLMIEGFVPSRVETECVDLTADLTGLNPKPCALVRRCRQEDRGLLLAFMEREFPGRWTFDVLDKLTHEPDPDFVVLLEVGGVIQGFAVIQDSTHRLRLAGAAVVGSLKSPWAAVGPIGIAKELRGRGFGSQLLEGVLAELKQAGVRSVRVDWTHLTDWYSRFGFAIERRYQPMHLDLMLPH